MAPQNRFDWLKTNHLRRSGLRDIEAAVRAGRLSGDAMADRRAELVAALRELLQDPELRQRESIRIGRIFTAFSEQDLQQQRETATAGSGNGGGG